jgi:trehalose-6-phosphate synthase
VWASAGVKPSRYIEGFEWPDTKWRIGELSEQLRGRTVLLGFDDLDAFKGIEMKLLAFERVLDYHEDWRGRLVLVQITNPPRSNSRETQARRRRHLRALSRRCSQRAAHVAPEGPALLKLSHDVLHRQSAAIK